MTPTAADGEHHLAGRVGWLRAAVLGANDGIISTGSLMIGVAAASTGSAALIAGVSGLAAGAMAMAAGEYVSVSSQADAEKAELGRENAELAARPDFELEELAQIYAGRGVEIALARQVAAQMTARDALGTHARDELGLSEALAARPVEAALASAAAFTAGAAMPLLAAFAAPAPWIVPAIAIGSLGSLAVLGALGAWAGGAPPLLPALRVTFWGAAALAVTAMIGGLVGHAA